MIDSVVNILHLLATAVWIGGAFFIHYILQPSLKSIDGPQGGKLMGIVAKKFSFAAWTCLLVLLVTGYIKTPDGMLFDLSSEMGIILTIKHVMVLMVIAVGLVIGLHVVPNMRRASPQPGEPPSAEFVGFQKKLGSLAMVNLILGILIVVLASELW